MQNAELKEKRIMNTGMHRVASWMALACWAAWGGAAEGQITQTSSVLDGSGTRSTGGLYTHISAGGQPGGIVVSYQNGTVNQAGFLQTFFLRPGFDTDGDGLPDEADLDNDGDGLADVTEIGGGSFNPVTPTLVNVADSDIDSVNDGAEAVAGTDPTDLNALFEIVALTNASGSRHVAWLARGNSERTYVARARESLVTGGDAVIFSNTVAGGIAPWYVVTNSAADATATNTEFFTVAVSP
jgi:hypothetical protein